MNRFIPSTYFTRSSRVFTTRKIIVVFCQHKFTSAYIEKDTGYCVVFQTSLQICSVNVILIGRFSLSQYTIVYRKYRGPKTKVEILEEILVFGFSELVQVLIQNVCLNLCMQRWRENYQIDFHQIHSKHIN